MSADARPVAANQNGDLAQLPLVLSVPIVLGAAAPEGEASSSSGLLSESPTLAQ